MNTVALAGSTPASDVVQFCKALADETRLAILRRLSLTDLRGSEMMEWLAIPHNALSYHLKYLRDIRLVGDRRSSADARDIYYHLDLICLRRLFAALGDALQVESKAMLEGQAQPPGLERPLRVLFLCTHNSARSQLAQGFAQCRGGGRIAAFSAGSHPTAVQPEALALLHAYGVDTTGYRAKPLAEVVQQTFDYVVTVCDRVREVCPSFPGTVTQLHWSIPDPVPIEDEASRQQAFSGVAAELDLRIEHFLRVVSKSGRVT